MNEEASFGHWVTLRRKALHFTRDSLAQRVGCAVVTLRKIEADERRPSNQIAERLADYLHLTPIERVAFIRAARGAARVDQLPHPSSVTASAGTQAEAQTAQRRRRNRLPQPLTSLVGRIGERDELRQLLLQQEVRLVTLIGAPGIGKTRLALQTAIDLGDAGLAQVADGVSFIQLAPIQDAQLVLPTLAQHLHITQAPGRSVLDQLADQLHDSRMLLVLDNFEQVADAAAHLAELLSATTQLKLLVTSRMALNLSGEQRFAVPPLAAPDAHALASHSGPEDALTRYAATRLFLERTRAIAPGFSPTPADARAIAHICQRLDGLPLAIELAAARMALFSPQELLSKLDRRLDVLTDGAVNLPERQRTLRNAIQWSFDLLDAGEQRLFRRLGVFAGGWTLAAAERVAGSPDLSTSVIADMQSLIIKSLVKQEGAGGEGETRFNMLETVREYALGRLEESSEAEAVRQWHAEFFVALAERVQPEMNGEDRRIWFTRFDSEQDNFRAALGWTLATGHAELGLRLAGALGEYWFWWASSWNEGWSWISQLLALPEAMQPEQARANALRVAVYLLKHLGDTAEANRRVDESLALLRELDDKMGMAWVLADKGCIAQDRTDYIEAVGLLDESVALFREVGDLRGLAWALNWRAGVARDRGQFEEAAELFDESVEAARAIGDDAIAGNVYRLFGELVYDTGDYKRADAVLRRAIELCYEGGDVDGANYTLTCLARVALAMGDLDSATAQLEASESWFRQARQDNGLTDVLYQLGYVRHLQGKGHEASALLREAMSLQWQQQLRRKLIQSLERCAWIAADLHQPQRAARLFGAAEAARERIGAPLPPGDKPLYDRHLARARADLDAPAFDAAWAEGRAMTLDEAIDYALSAL